jgi:hypothetical protein
LVGYWWLERVRTRVYTWQPLLRRWVEDQSVLIAAPARLVQRDKDDDAYPCGRGGEIAEEYSHEADSSLCEGAFVCINGAAAYDGGPCLRVPPARGAPTTFREQSTEVTAVLRCAYERELPKVETPPMNINDEVGKDDSKDGQNLKPFRLEKDAYLGGSDFQLRSVVYDGDVPEGAEQVVALSEWGRATDEGIEPQGSALATSFAAMGRVALGQAEYYFDWTGIDGELDDETDEGDRTEWLWNLGWRARMRPFRLRHSVADAERTEKDDEPDAEQSKFVPEEAKAHPPGELDCEGLGDGCDQAKQVIDVFGEGDSDEE